MPNPKDLLEADKVKELAVQMDEWSIMFDVPVGKGLSDGAAYLRRYGFLLEHHWPVFPFDTVAEANGEIERLRECIKNSSEGK